MSSVRSGDQLRTSDTQPTMECPSSPTTAGPTVRRRRVGSPNSRHAVTYIAETMYIDPSGNSGMGSTHTHLGAEQVGMKTPSSVTMGSISSCLEEMAETIPDEGMVLTTMPPRYFRMEASKVAPATIDTGCGVRFTIFVLFFIVPPGSWTFCPPPIHYVFFAAAGISNLIPPGYSVVTKGSNSL